MSTGILAILNAASITYAPISNAKLRITPSSTSTVATISVGGSVTTSAVAGFGTYQSDIYVGAGQSVTIAIATAPAIISVIEES